MLLIIAVIVSFVIGFVLAKLKTAVLPFKIVKNKINRPDIKIRVFNKSQPKSSLDKIEEQFKNIRDGNR